jgi:hypothetical protein
MSKYESTRKANQWEKAPSNDSHWSMANGGDIIKSYICRPNHHGNHPGIEEKLNRLIDAVGMITDHAGVNLLEVFHETDLQDWFRLNKDEN